MKSFAVRPLRSCLAGMAFLAVAPLSVSAEESIGAYLSARVAVQAGDYETAAEAYARALNTDPGNVQLLKGLIGSQIGVGDIPKAAEAAAQLTAQGAADQLAGFATLADAAGREDYAAILDLQAKGLRLGDLLDGLITGWAQVGAGRMSEAVTAFDTLAARPGFEAFGLYHKALAMGVAGDFEGAEGILSGSAAGPITLTKSGIFAHVQILSQLERNAEAVVLLDKTFGTEPDPVVTPLRARLIAGEPVPFDSIRSAKDGLAEVFFTVANALASDSSPTFSYVHARIAAYLNPQHSDATLLSAGLLEQMGQHDMAARTYGLIGPDLPTYPVAEAGRAEALFNGGQKDQAAAALTALAATHGQYFFVQSALGDLMRKTEAFVPCVAAYDAAAGLVPEVQPRHWVLFFGRGICHERLADWPKAEADFRQALALNPNQPQVLNYLGYSMVDRNENLEEGLSLIERAVAAEPEAGYIVDSLAWALFRLGRYDEALAPMEKASLLEPVDPVVTDHLGDVYWVVGRQREADFQWRRALSLDPTETDATRIRRKLEVGLDAVMQEEAGTAEAGTEAGVDDGTANN